MKELDAAAIEEIIEDSATAGFRIKGMIDKGECALLARVAIMAVKEFSGKAFIEIGSYMGRSTVAIASALKAVDTGSSGLIAIDPHEGHVTNDHTGKLDFLGQTFDVFIKNIESCGLTDVVYPLRSSSTRIDPIPSIGFMFIDGLHDYDSVSADFRHFENGFLPGAYICLDDNFKSFPGVMKFVKELLESGVYEDQKMGTKLTVLRKKK